MAVSNQMPSFLATMKWEGGSALSLNRNDPGNWTGGRVGVGELKGTKWGVAAGSHPNLDIRNLTEQDALPIFLNGYWNPVGGDQLSIGLDHCVSDDSYNAGPGRANQHLHKMLSSITTNSTVAKIHAYSRLRLSFLEALTTWRIFGKPWMNRIIGVEAESIKMVPSNMMMRSSINKEISSIQEDLGNTATMMWLLLLILLISIIWFPIWMTSIVGIGFIYSMANNIWNHIVHTKRLKTLKEI